MLKHIVCWKIKDSADGSSRKENLEKMKRDLEALPMIIKEIIDFEVGINFNSSDTAYDISLYSSFKDQEALQKYQKHPNHEKVAEFIRSITEKRAVVDYNL